MPGCKISYGDKRYMVLEASYGKGGRVILQTRYGSAGISEKRLCSWGGHMAALNDKLNPQCQPEMVRKWVAEMSAKATFSGDI